MTAPTGAPSVPAPLVMLRCDQNAFYRRSIETPELLDVVELRELAIRTRENLPKDSTPPLPPDVDVFDEWLQAVPRFDEIAKANAVKDAALGALIGQCDTRISGHVLNIDRHISVLAQDLPPIMAGITDAVHRLDGAHTPTEAIAANKGDVWNEIRTEHCPVWDAFWEAFDWHTAAHMLYHSAQSDYLFDDDLASRARIRNISTVFSAWKQPAPNHALQNWDADPRPWPTDPVGQKIWIVTSGAEIWAPTPNQLRQPQEELSDNESPHEPDDVPILNETPLQTEGLHV
jgi:hypothetical protein